MHYFFYAFTLLCSLTTSAYASLLIAPITPSARAFYYSTSTFGLFLGAAQTSTGEIAEKAIQFTLIDRPTLDIMGITPETATLNGVPNVQNPLHGAHISLLAGYGNQGKYGYDNLPVAVTQDQPTLFYAYDHIDTNGITISSSGILLDTNGEETAGIAAIVGSGFNNIITVLTPHTGAIGDNGTTLSCSSLLETNTITHTKSWQQTQRTAINKSSSLIHTNIAYPLNILNNPILHITAWVWNNETIPLIQYVFSGWHAQSYPGQADTVISLLSYTSFANNNMPTTVLQPAAPLTAISGNNIVAATGTDIELWIHNLCDLQPTTGGQYIVVVGGLGNELDTQKMVFALPVTNSGKLAAKSAPLSGLRADGIVTPIMYTQPAQISGDLYNNTDPEVIVGAGVAPGQVTAVFSSGDAVLISVDSGDGIAPGTFASRAVFDFTGKIVGWTAWQRYLPSSVACAGSFFYPSTARAIQATLEGGVITSLRKMSFGQSANPHGLSALTSDWFLNGAGVQGIIDIPSNTPLFNQTIGSRMSACMLLSNAKAALIQTGVDVDAVFTPQFLYSERQALTDNGTADFENIPTQAISFSDKILDALGPIITGTIVTIGTQSWIVVGGTGGIAALADGTSFAGIANESISGFFQGLSNNLRWFLLTQTPSVRTIWASGNQLYWQTTTGLYRADYTVTPGIGITLENQIALLENTNNQSIMFNQVLTHAVSVSDCIIVAASNGVWFSQNPQDETSRWQKVPVAENNNGATWIQLIQAPGNFSGPVNAVNVEVIGTRIGIDISRLYRFTITNAGGTAIITPFASTIFNNYLPGLFFAPGGYRSQFFSDGGWMGFGNYHQQPLVVPALIQALPYNYRIDNIEPTQLNLQLPWHDARDRRIAPMIRCSGSGQMIFPTNRTMILYQ